MTIVSGVLKSKFANSPIVKIRKTAAKRQKLAEALQILRQMAFPSGIRPMSISLSPSRLEEWTWPGERRCLP